MPETFNVSNWTDYFADFSVRHLGRPARLEIFGEFGALMEIRRFPLAGISVEMTGPEAPLVEIHFGGLSAKNSENITHSVPFVSSIMALAASNMPENAVEFETADGTKTLLSFDRSQNN